MFMNIALKVLKKILKETQFAMQKKKLSNQLFTRLNWSLISFILWKSFWTCSRKLELIKRSKVLLRTTFLGTSSLMLQELFQNWWWERHLATIGWRSSEWLMLLDLRNLCNLCSVVHSKNILRKDKMILPHSLDLSFTLFTLATLWPVSGCTLENSTNAMALQTVIAPNHGSLNVVSMISQTIRSIFSRFIGFSKLSQLSDMEIMLVLHQMNIFSPLLWNLWDLLSSLSLWDPSTVFSTLPIISMIWLKKSLIHSTCGLRKLKSQTNHSISNQLCITISESTSNRLSFMISTWLSKSSNSINKSPQRCKLTWFKTPESSRNLKNHSTISSKNAKEDLPTSLLSACIVEFTLQVRLSSVIEAMLKKCISSDKVWLKFSTMKMTKLTRRSQFFTYQNTLTSEIIKSCTTLSPT